MKKSAYGNPLVIQKHNVKSLERLEEFSELMIQNLVFTNPECLPISDIDESYNPLIPICKELRTQVGSLDILMATPNGDLAIVETKLWRNPEARRKVVAQIIDYANEVSNWTYEDMQRELNRNLKTKGNILYKILKDNYPDDTLRESEFVDNISRNLNKGKFLLLIVGDGIKEGAASITEFLSTSGQLNFVFGMVELTIYTLNSEEQIILPRTIAKTVEIQKINIELPDGMRLTSAKSQSSDDVKVNPALEERRIFFTRFWKEFVEELDLDDPGQSLPEPTRNQNLFVYPEANKNSRISAYFSQSTKRVGVYFRCANNQKGHNIAEIIFDHKAQILKELGEEINWSAEKPDIDIFAVRFNVEDVYDNQNRELIKDFFKHWINQFVNTLRPILKEK